MKKRVAALVGAVLLVASMSMTAFATPSVTGLVTGITTATSKDGKPIEVTTDINATVPAGSAKIIVTGLSTDLYVEEVANVKKIDTIKTLLGDKYVDGMQVADLKHVRYVGDAGVAAGLLPVTVNFEAKSVGAEDIVQVLVYSDTAKAWKVLDAKAGNGVITATFSEYGPVAFVVKDIKSPSTGETTMMMWAIAAVVIGAVGVVASKKRA